MKNVATFRSRTPCTAGYMGVYFKEKNFKASKWSSLPWEVAAEGLALLDCEKYPEVVVACMYLRGFACFLFVVSSHVGRSSAHHWRRGKHTYVCCLGLA
jgi:hypothetical protein